MTPHTSLDGWSIPTERLTGPRKTGGGTSIKGFAYQEAYACLCLVNLLDPARGVAAVRYEGAQDLDILYSDGRETYVQLKNEPGASYTLNKLRPVLQGFAADLLESEGKGEPGFELVARSNVTDAAVKRLSGGDWSEDDLSEVADLLSKSTESSSAPECLRGLVERERRDLAERLLGRTTFTFGMGDEVDGRLSFQSHACVGLANHGVAGHDLQDAFETLRAALKPQRTFTRYDVEDILKRFIGGATIELFDGRVEILTDELLSTPATPEKVKLFHRGEALLDWPIIAASGDIERDKQEDLIAKLLEPSQGLRLVCLVAEPGAGKSTLARRAAVELHRRHGALVVRVKAKDDADVWYHIPAFSQKVARPFYVIADDLFRFPEVVSALGELSGELPVTIIATSRRNEYQPPRIRGELVEVPLVEPSKDEKLRILERLNKSRAVLTPEQRARLDAASQFLVLMMETSEGKELRRIIEDTLSQLRVRDESAYRAYEYVSFTYQYGLSLPESLLTRLDAAGRFHRLSERPSTQGLVFHNEGGAGGLRAGHPLVAAAAVEYYFRDPAAVLREIVSKADSLSPDERAYVGHLFRVMAQAGSPALRAALPHLEEAVADLQRHATTYDLALWRNVYKALGLDDLAESCLDRALTLAPVSSRDVYNLLVLFRECGREEEALAPISKWLKSQPDSYAGQQVYLGLIGRYGTDEEVAATIEEFGSWFAQHPGGDDARIPYMGLVEWRGSAGQVERCIREIGEWLARYPGDPHVRAKYLGLVERRAGDEQVKRCIQETDEWLSQHPDDIHVRMTFLGLLEKRGSPKQIAQVIIETGEWLARYDGDQHVRTKYLGLVERRAEDEQIKRCIADMGEWLARHPDDTAVRAGYLGLVGRCGGTALVDSVIDETKEWLRGHEGAKEVWEPFLALLFRSGRNEEAADLARQAISLHPYHQNFVYQFTRSLKGSSDGEAVRQAYEKLISNFPDEEHVTLFFANWLSNRDHLSEARVLYTRMLEAHPDDSRIHHRYGLLLLKEGKFDEAAAEFRKVIRLRQDSPIGYDGLARAMSKLGEMAEREGKGEYAERFFTYAEREFRRAISYADVERRTQAPFYSNLGSFYIARGRHAEAVTAFKVAIRQSPTFSINYRGLGRALIGMGRFREAEQALLTALETLPQNSQPAAEEETQELLRQCRETLSRSEDEPER